MLKFFFRLLVSRLPASHTTTHTHIMCYFFAANPPIGCTEVTRHSLSLAGCTAWIDCHNEPSVAHEVGEMRGGEEGAIDCMCGRPYVTLPEHASVVCLFVCLSVFVVMSGMGGMGVESGCKYKRLFGCREGGVYLSAPTRAIYATRHTYSIYSIYRSVGRTSLTCWFPLVVCPSVRLPACLPACCVQRLSVYE